MQSESKRGRWRGGCKTAGKEGKREKREKRRKRTAGRSSLAHSS
jgi:hypothetical protein